MLGELTGTRDQAPDMLGTVAGWRGWQMNRRGELTSPLIKVQWEANEPVFAEHIDRKKGTQERMCAAHCHCGVNACHTLDDLMRTKHDYGDLPVLGEVQLWGRVREYESGYRAEYAYPSQLWRSILHTTLAFSALHDARRISARYGVPCGILLNIRSSNEEIDWRAWADVMVRVQRANTQWRWCVDGIPNAPLFTGLDRWDQTQMRIKLGRAGADPALVGADVWSNRLARHGIGRTMLRVAMWACLAAVMLGMIAHTLFMYAQLIATPAGNGEGAAAQITKNNRAMRRRLALMALLGAAGVAASAFGHPDARTVLIGLALAMGSATMVMAGSTSQATNRVNPFEDEHGSIYNRGLLGLIGQMMLPPFVSLLIFCALQSGA